MAASTGENALRELVVERFLASWCDIGALEPPAYGQWQSSGGVALQLWNVEGVVICCGG